MPFDERFFVYYEETDWLIRAKRRGWKTVFLPAIEAVHSSAGSSPGVRSRPSLLLLESQHRYARKHFGPVTTAFLRATLAGIDTARLARHALTGRTRATSRGARSHPCPRHDARPAAIVDTLEISYAGSLEHVSATDWGSLAERAGHVFATREWLLTWWRHYGKAGTSLIGLVRRGGQPAAIVPMYVWWRHGVPVLRFVGHGPSDQLGPICAPLADPDAAAAVAGAIDAIPLRRFVLLAEHVAGDQGFAALNGACPLYRESSPVLRFEVATWDEFLEQRGRNFRQQVRRFPRKLGELGAVSYRLAADPDRLQRDLDTLFRLHRARWGGAETPFLQAAAFHREFAQLALREGWLRLRFLEIDGRPVAALYGFRFAGAESAYQAGRDPALRQPAGRLRPACPRRARGTRGRDARVPSAARRRGVQGAVRDQRPRPRDVWAPARGLCAGHPPGSSGRPRPIARPAADSRPAMSFARSDRAPARCSRAGLPATITLAGTSRVTTAPAPTSAPAPMRTPARMTAPEPIAAPRSIVVDCICQSARDFNSPVAVVARGKRSLMNITPCPTNTSSSMTMPSQTNVWLWILQLPPTTTPR